MIVFGQKSLLFYRRKRTEKRSSAFDILTATRSVFLTYFIVGLVLSEVESEVSFGLIENLMGKIVFSCLTRL